jgi:hypothetical protein
MSGNPVPQHNPTDGLGVAAEVVISASDATGLSVPVTTVAAHEYTMILSKSGASGYDVFVNLTLAAKDVKGGIYNPQGNFFVRNPANPSAGSPAFYKPSNFAGYTADVFSAVASGTNNSNVLVTALAVGEGTLELCFPTFDNTEAGSTPEMVYAKLDVTVIP